MIHIETGIVSFSVSAKISNLLTLIHIIVSREVADIYSVNIEEMCNRFYLVTVTLYLTPKPCHNPLQQSTHRAQRHTLT